MLICLGVLALAARGLAEVNLGITAIRGLPGESEERRAAVAAGEGFAPGVLAPLTVLVEGDAELLKTKARAPGELACGTGRRRRRHQARETSGRRVPELVTSESERRRFATW